MQKKSKKNKKKPLKKEIAELPLSDTAQYQVV